MLIPARSLLESPWRTTRLAAASTPSRRPTATTGKYNEAQFSDNTNVGNPDLLLGIYAGPPGEGRDFEAGFDPDNYTTVFGEVLQL